MSSSSPSIYEPESSNEDEASLSEQEDVTRTNAVQRLPAQLKAAPNEPTNDDDDNDVPRQTGQAAGVKRGRRKGRNEKEDPRRKRQKHETKDAKRPADADDDEKKKPLRRPKQKHPHDFKKREPVHLSVPDWDLIAASEFGSTPLTQYLPHIEVDSLIGWATHVSSNRPSANPNPLLNLGSAPLRPGELHMIHAAMTEFIVKERDADNFSLLYREFDQSALVGLGICLEEMITASLFPLAQAHVRRCQSIDDPQTLHEEITLPPEEAILKLQPQDYGLPTARPATHAEPSKMTNSFFRPPADVQAQRALHRWLTTHDIDFEFFDKNRDTYALLLGRHILGQPNDDKAAAARAPSPVVVADTEEEETTPIQSFEI